MKNKIKIVFVICLFLILTNNTCASDYPCNCEKDRVLKLEKPFMRGEDVESLQSRLNEIGFYHGTIDGVYGRRTYWAIKNFQHVYKLEENGIVDSHLYNVLGTLSDSRITSRKGKSPSGELRIEINLYSRRLTLFSDNKAYKSYPVAIGKEETPTPVGEWIIKNKAVRRDEGPLGTRWLGLNVPWGVYGIHGTNKPWQIGTSASQGCVRLHNQYIEELFDWVGVNTTVRIIGPLPEYEINSYLKSGNIGYDVMELQRKLREHKFYIGYLDGIYSTGTIEAVKEMESQFHIKIDGIADFDIFELLMIDYNPR